MAGHLGHVRCRARCCEWRPEPSLDRSRLRELRLGLLQPCLERGETRLVCFAITPPMLGTRCSV